jgi:hypothetical protein
MDDVLAPVGAPAGICGPYDVGCLPHRSIDERRGETERSFRARASDEAGGGRTTDHRSSIPSSSGTHDPYRGCPVYDDHGACICSTGLHGACADLGRDVDDNAGLGVHPHVGVGGQLHRLFGRLRIPGWLLRLDAASDTRRPGSADLQRVRVGRLDKPVQVRAVTNG